MFRRKSRLKRFFVIFGAILTLLALVALTLGIVNRVHKSNMEAYIDDFAEVEYERRLTPDVDERGNYFFTTDGDFKVMQLTDLHFGGGFLFADGDKKAIHAVAEMISVEKPDLVILTGDVSFAVPWSGTLDNSIAHGYLKRLMENLGVYWTVTFGNHDAEKYNYYDRSAVGRMYLDESLEYCLFTESPEDIFGESNHIITVRNGLGLTTSAYVMIDSNSYTDKDIFGLGWDYDNVHADQIEWYKENIEYYTAKNAQILAAIPEGERPADFDTEAVRSFMYMHIPPEEMNEEYHEALAGDITDIEKYGIAGEEDRVIYSSEYPDELFETVAALGSTKAIFFGHDHLNSLRFEREGVLLSYGYSIDYSAYAGDTGYQRGCTVLTVRSDGEDIVYNNYYSGKYENIDDGTDLTLPKMYR